MKGVTEVIVDHQGQPIVVREARGMRQAGFVVTLRAQVVGIFRKPRIKRNPVVRIARFQLDLVQERGYGPGRRSLHIDGANTKRRRQPHQLFSRSG